MKLKRKLETSILINKIEGILYSFQKGYDIEKII
jgi:hypothetical protein